jgi:hypothetical protein
MAHKILIVALSMIAATSPLSATSPEPPTPTAPAPAGTSETQYCMRVEAVTGTRLETIECWTRAEWAEQGVDVDQDWAREGVEVRG